MHNFDSPDSTVLVLDMKEGELVPHEILATNYKKNQVVPIMEVPSVTSSESVRSEKSLASFRSDESHGFQPHDLTQMTPTMTPAMTPTNGNILLTRSCLASPTSTVAEEISPEKGVSNFEASFDVSG